MPSSGAITISGRGLQPEDYRLVLSQALKSIGEVEVAGTAPNGKIGLVRIEQLRPDLVILDEPMSGLDPIGRREVRDLILELKAAGKTIFFSSHILSDVERVCDTVAILNRGRVLEVGGVEELVEDDAGFGEPPVARQEAAQGEPTDIGELTRVDFGMTP